MQELPSGTVTFLMTDIEGSTALWERYPSAMPATLLLHEEIISTAVSDHGGLMVKRRGEGDSTFSAFACASDAVAASLDIQLNLGRANW
jgi:class 3 adenylate cyclase